MQSVFDFQDYRAFLLAALPKSGVARGARNRLAAALSCQKGFVSQVLSGTSHFSLEHGVKIARFLSLDGNEEEYFLLLLHKGRAGSKDLENFYEKRILEIHERRKQIKERIRSHTNMSEADQVVYYSSWIFSAVHMSLMIPGVNTRAAISSFLGITQEVAAKALDFLLQVRLAKQEGDKWSAGPSRIHLTNDSPLISKHHTNWRIRAIDSLDAPKEIDIHYSLVMSISDDAAEKIRKILLATIQEVEPVMKAAADQALFTLNLDFFSLQK